MKWLLSFPSGGPSEAADHVGDAGNQVGKISLRQSYLIAKLEICFIPMDKREARQLLEEFVTGLKSRSYQEWQGLIGEEAVVERNGPSGVTYQIEWNAFWDSPAGGDIRVMVSIDDGSLARFICPLTTSFLISPEG